MSDKLVILYDGDCSLCQKAKAWLAEIDRDKALTLIPLQSDVVQAEFATLDRWAIRAQLHGICPDGRVVIGAQALAEVGRVISTQTLRGKLLWVYAQCMQWPYFAQWAQKVYVWIAKNRQRLYLPAGIDGVACTVQPPKASH